MGLIPPFIGAVVFTIVQAIVFLFVLIATPLPQFGCYYSGTVTLWGRKVCGSGTRYYQRTRNFACTRLRDNMGAGAAFAIISIVVTLITLVFGALMLLRCKCAILIPLITSCIAVLTILICWACVADMHRNRHCGGYVYGYNYNYGTNTYGYGPGFGLMVTAWVLQLLNTALVVVLAFF